MPDPPTGKAKVLAKIKELQRDGKGPGQIAKKTDVKIEEVRRVLRRERDGISG